MFYSNEVIFIEFKLVDKILDVSGRPQNINNKTNTRVADIILSEK